MKKNNYKFIYSMLDNSYINWYIINYATQSTKGVNMNEIIMCRDCGKPTIRRCPTTIRCLPCQKEADQQRIERWKDNIKKADRDFGGYYGKPTVCICPMCGKQHTIRLDWTGHGTPRVYCHACKAGMVDTYGYAQENEKRFEVQI
jgi:hypothetical protein